MKKAAIFSFVKVSDKSMVASVRVARYVAQLLGVPLIDNGDIAKAAPEVLIIINGAFAFCSCLEELGTAVQKAKKIVWVQQDYTIIPPINDGNATSPFRRAFTLRRERGLDHIHMWSTVPEKITTALGHYCNWNCLTLDDADDATVAKRREGADDDLFYYGSFRSGRVKDFDRYFIDPRLETQISSPSKKFAERYPQCGHHGKIEGSFYHELGQHGLGLYVEDKWSHSHFCSPANRFYEMLSAGLPMVFQPECGSMLRKAGYDPAPYYCDGARKVPELMKRREAIGAEQRARWLPLARQEREKLDEAVFTAWDKLEKVL
jgi:hypothetical protein